MESLSCVLLAIAISLLIIKFLNYPHRRKNLPPGPRPWPLIGNLNLLGHHPHQSLHKLSKTYGKLMHLRLGSSSVVVASSPDMAREFLRTHDRIFASRPPSVAGKLINNNYHNVLWAPYGDQWIQGRKIYHNEVFSPKRLDSSEYIRVQEMHIFLSRLHVLSGNPMVLKGHFLSMNLSVINRIVLGRKYFNESKDEKEIMTLEEFQEMLDEFFLLNGVTNVGDWMPWMGFMDLQGYVKRMKALFKRFDRFNEHVLEDHRKRMRAEGEDFVAKDVVDVLLKLADDPNLQVKLNSEDVKGLTQDLIIGSTNTTTTTMEWAMSELIKKPHLIEKATEELDRVIGKTMRLLMANMLQGFNWKLPENMRAEDVDMEELYGLGTRRKFPLVIVAEPRLRDHMYN
ncbi:hypothetical protein L6452_15442 [Arctium lappa]|uniref:Uncharacterized protein n=1 Tax=Arctium lappa TaxID=4217 RepID=A0ACB9CNR3_ARCLA|nr:hypothetical protein L6452_15442 [Arctium lappa]